MAVEQDKSGQASEPTGARIAALVRDAQRALAEAEQLLTEVQEASDALRATRLAARQAAIVDAAHEEAAVILAKAHADAARILELAVTGRRVGPSGASPAGPERRAVVDLRDDDPSPAPDDSSSDDSTPDDSVFDAGVDAASPNDTAAAPTPSVSSGPSTTAPVPDPAPPSRPSVAPALPDAVDPLDQDVRASIAAAAEMARRVSGRIERLSQDLHQAPAP